MEIQSKFQPIFKFKKNIGRSLNLKRTDHKFNLHAPNLHACIIYIRVNILPVCIFGACERKYTRELIYICVNEHLGLTRCKCILTFTYVCILKLSLERKVYLLMCIFISSLDV